MDINSIAAIFIELQVNGFVRVQTVDLARNLSEFLEKSGIEVVGGQDSDGFKVVIKSN